MTTIEVRTFRIFGPNAGKTAIYGGHEFHQGLMRMRESAEVLAMVSRKMARYGAFHEGSDEYKAALLQEELEKEAQADGIHDPDEPGKEPGEADKTEGEDGSTGEGSTDPSPVLVPASDDAQAGPEGIVPERDGHEHAGLPGDERPVAVEETAAVVEDPAAVNGNAVVEDPAVVVDETPAAEVDDKMRKIVMSLDPDVDEHWNDVGTPAMEAIEEAYGADFAREDVNNAVPEWTREKAREIKDLS